jgi:molybdopterin synthase sulfur carrier subunit
MTILLFGVARDIVGSNSLSLPLSSASQLNTVAELRTYLGKTYPRLNGITSLAIAVNNSYAHDTDTIDNFDEIALIPPVSGG